MQANAAQFSAYVQALQTRHSAEDPLKTWAAKPNTALPEDVQQGAEAHFGNIWRAQNAGQDKLSDADAAQRFFDFARKQYAEVLDKTRAELEEGLAADPVQLASVSLAAAGLELSDEQAQELAPLFQTELQRSLEATQAAVAVLRSDKPVNMVEFLEAFAAGSEQQANVFQAVGQA